MIEAQEASMRIESRGTAVEDSRRPGFGSRYWDVLNSPANLAAFVAGCVFAGALSRWALAYTLLGVACSLASSSAWALLVTLREREKGR